MKDLIVYTDGACSQNGTWNGGWAFKIVDDISICISGPDVETTNNRMELKAAVEALKYVFSKEMHKGKRVLIHADSAYVVNAFKQNWIGPWLKNGWINSKKEPVKNKDLWMELLDNIDLISKDNIGEVGFVKVAGHSNDQHNIDVDRAAVLACKSIK
jgi:ribonuclease HI